MKINFRRVVLGAVVGAAMLFVSACGAEENGVSEENAVEFALDANAPVFLHINPPAVGDEIAIIHTSLGDMVFQFFPEVAPMAVENFLTHARNGFYDGIIFHRIIENFMIQGGDPLGTGTGGESIWGHDFQDEFSETARNVRGALSMANRGPATNSSQFFIVNNHSLPPHIIEELEWVLENFDELDMDEELYYVVHDYINHGGALHLDFVHTVFGQLIAGWDVLELLSNVETDAGDRPLEEVYIISITVTTF